MDLSAFIPICCISKKLPEIRPESFSIRIFARKLFRDRYFVESARSVGVVALYHRKAAFLNYAIGLKPPACEYVAFGSYGWGGGAIKYICETLDKAGYKKLGEVGCIYKPETLDLNFLSDIK